MTSLSAVEASFLRYLYENLEVPHGVTIFEDLTSADFSSEGKWVVIDTLANSLGGAPRQSYFLHVATHKSAPNPKAALTALVDLVKDLVEMGQEITLYNPDTDAVIGTLHVVQHSTGPVLQHKGGGGMRTLNIALAYPA
jgi:hypothetical protein